MRGLVAEEQVTAMLKPEILFLLLHLRHRILDESHVTDLVLDRMHDANWHAIDLAQIDGGRVNPTVDPILEADRLLELLSDTNLAEVHKIGHRHASILASMVDTIFAKINVVVP